MCLWGVQVDAVHASPCTNVEGDVHVGVHAGRQVCVRKPTCALFLRVSASCVVQFPGVRDLGACGRLSDSAEIQ